MNCRASLRCARNSSTGKNSSRFRIGFLSGRMIADVVESSRARLCANECKFEDVRKTAPVKQLFSRLTPGAVSSPRQHELDRGKRPIPQTSRGIGRPRSVGRGLRQERPFRARPTQSASRSSMPARNRQRHHHLAAAGTNCVLFPAMRQAFVDRFQGRHRNKEWPHHSGSTSRGHTPCSGGRSYTWGPLRWLDRSKPEPLRFILVPPAPPLFHSSPAHL